MVITPVRLVAFAAATLLGAASGEGSQEAEARRELRVFTTRAIATVLEHVGADFERRTGRTLVITTDVAIRMVRRITAGEAFDVLVAAPGQIDELIRAGTIIPDSRTDLARSGIGVAVRSGAPKPDVSSVAAFTRALIEAQSIAFLKEGQSGVYVAGLLERLNIADRVRSKLTLPETDIVSDLVSRGEIELGIVVITQILTTKGVTLAGPLPPELQSYITFTSGISAKSSAVDAARQLIDMLKSPVAGAIMRSQGMEPATERPGQALSVLSAISASIVGLQQGDGADGLTTPRRAIDDRACARSIRPPVPTWQAPPSPCVASAAATPP